MPGKNNHSLDPDPTRGGDFYCGANAGKHGGNNCPEVDVLEANMYALQTTLHTCVEDGKRPGYFPTCDQHGCHTNVYNTDARALGPGSAYRINTLHPFRHAVSFELGENGTLARVRNVLTQGQVTVGFRRQIPRTYDDTTF